MKVKCLVCGEDFKVLNEMHLRTHGLTRQEYLDWFFIEYRKGVLEPKKYGYVTKNCIVCGKPFRVKHCNIGETIRCPKCQRLYVRHYKSLYDKKVIRTLGFYKGEFRHTFDKTNDLTVKNGRIKGALWLLEEMKKKPNRRRFLKWLDEHKNPKRFCSGHFIVIDDNHTPYCAECGGKIVKARENQIYSTTEYACSSCGLVLEA